MVLTTEFLRGLVRGWGGFLGGLGRNTTNGNNCIANSSLSELPCTFVYEKRSLHPKLPTVLDLGPGHHTLGGMVGYTAQSRL